MSKITRKKSPKSPAGAPARAKSRNTPKKPAKSAAAKTGKAAAKKSVKGASTKPRTTAKASQKTASKPLKPSGRSESVAVPESKASSTKPPAPKLISAGVPRPTSEAAVPPPLGLREGAKAPGFRLPRDGGATVELADFKGSRLVLFFYPRADTPGCTKEAIDFSRLSSAFAATKTAVLGVSADSPKAQQSFRDKHELLIPLVSDEQHQMLDAYGVWGEKSMYGRTFLGITRTTVLIGADGRVVKIWRNVKVDGHAEDVLATVQSL